MLCADGLSGISEAISAAFPMTEYQRCIVHMVRNTLKYVADKDRKNFANDLKTIYQAPDEETAHRNMLTVSEAMVTSVTNKILPEIEEWQKRPLSAVYPIVYIDAIVFNVRSEGIIRKHAAYVILGVSEEGHKEVLSITVGDNESAKFWLSVLNELKKQRCQRHFRALRRRFERYQ